MLFWDFPGGPVVKTPPSNMGGAGSIPGREVKSPHALRPKKRKRNIKQKQYCNKLNKDFKIIHINKKKNNKTPHLRKRKRCANPILHFMEKEKRAHTRSDLKLIPFYFFFFFFDSRVTMGFPGGSVVRNPPANAGDMGLIPALVRFPGEGNGNPL